MAVTKMIERGRLQEVDANLRRNAPLWGETDDGHGTTLVVKDAGLPAIGIVPVVVETMVAIHENAAETPEAKQPTPRPRTKQAMLIALLRAPDGATMEKIVTTTGWLAHTARGALGKKTGADCDFGEGGRQRAGLSDPDIPIALIQWRL